MQHITILDDVRFALDPQFSSIARTAFAITCNIIIVGYSFCANKATLEITMNYSSSLGGSSANTDCPCTRFFGTYGKICFQSQKPVSRLN